MARYLGMMRQPSRLLFKLFLAWSCLSTVGPVAGLETPPDQHPLAHGDVPAVQQVSDALFASLERSARLVDITYCVGNTGISPPFSCISRCKDFPTLHLVTAWNTGILLSDSCGYIAVDHGTGRSGRDVEALDGAHGPGDGTGGRPAIVVAFRGTYSITNTVVDLSTIPQEYVPYQPPDDGDEEPAQRCSNCTVHMGFLASWRNARELVLPALKSVREKHPTYPIHLIGHSLGGAVAALASLEMKVSLGWHDVKVTTFGEPRVGNDGLVSYLDKTFGLDHDDGYDPDLERRAYQRVTHVNDPVPLLPLSEWGYRSHAGEIYISKSNLPPAPKDVHMCRGDSDGSCIAGAESANQVLLHHPLDDDAEGPVDMAGWITKGSSFPGRLKLWQLFFAHRDYFWRLGLCVPGGDPFDWGRERYSLSSDAGEL